jgi:hypothetical protein
MSSFQELVDSGVLQLYDTISGTQKLASAELDISTTKTTVINVETVSPLTEKSTRPDFIPATLNPRVTPVIIFG